MDILSEEINNNNFSRVYLLYGEEAYLVSANKKRLADAVVSPDDTMNRACFSGKEAGINEIMELSETLPFLAEKRLILVEDSGFFRNAVDDSFVEYMGNIPEGTVIVFAESEVDKRTKMYKAVKEHGRIISCDPLKGEELIAWTGRYLSKYGKKIRKKTAELMFERVGTDMNMLKQEMDKLSSFTGDREEITEADLKEACAANVDASVFAMVDDMAAGRRKRALEKYYELILQKEPPLRILYLISREFNMLLLSKELSENREMSTKEKARIMKIPEFAVGKYRSAASRFTRKQILGAMDDCVETENDIKKGKISDRMGLELLIIRYSGAETEGINA